MKTITKLLVVLLFAFSVKANAQITLLKTYPTDTSQYYVQPFQPVYLKHSGYKFVFLHSDTLTFYNLNLSLYKNAIFPAYWLSGPPSCHIEYISEGLFDLDTLHIDYSIVNAYGDSIVVYKDDGTVVYRNDTACDWFSLGGMGFTVSSPIITTDSGTFMILRIRRSSATQLYKLPGSLQCIPGCNSNDYITYNPVTNLNNGAMKAYPNPAVSYTNIYYTLPPGTNEGELILYDLAGREMKKYTVTSQVDHLRLTTSDIAAGTYFYQLTVNGSGVSTKKVVVVK